MNGFSKAKDDGKYPMTQYEWIKTQLNMCVELERREKDAEVACVIREICEGMRQTLSMMSVEDAEACA